MHLFFIESFSFVDQTRIFLNRKIIFPVVSGLIPLGKRTLYLPFVPNEASIIPSSP